MAMTCYLVGVVGLLITNFWFMAGQRLTLQALAHYEPTSCIMEWLHDAVFGISEERLAAAQHTGKRTRKKDGKTYVELVVPRRKVPYPVSFGGAIHRLFFYVDDQFDSDQIVLQVLRSLTIFSILVLFVQTSIMDWMYGAGAHFAEAVALQKRGEIDAAVQNYITVLRQDPLHNPHVAAMHFSLLGLQHAWAAGLYLVAASFHATGDVASAARFYRQSLEQSPDNVLASHALRALGHDVPAADKPDTPPGSEVPLAYVRAAFDGYAASYDSSMSRLAARAPEMLAAALGEVLAAADSSKTLHRTMELGCGTGALAPLVARWAAPLDCVDASPRMLDAARRRGGYTALAEGEMAEALRGRDPGDLQLLLAADVLPYKGDLGGIFRIAARATGPGGRFAFTVEALMEDPPTAETKGWQLLSNGRVAHSRHYVETEAAHAGWEVQAVGGGALRWEGAQAVAGHVFVLVKA